MFDLLTDPKTASAILAVLSAVVAYLARSAWVTRYRLDRGLLFIESGVAHAYENYVRAIKLASEDGTLTTQERANARTEATRVAIELAYTEGWDILRYYSGAAMDALIERFVRKAKAEAAAAIPNGAMATVVAPHAGEPQPGEPKSL